MGNTVNLDLPDRFWKSRAEAAEAECVRLRMVIETLTDDLSEKHKAEAFDDLAPDLAELHKISILLGCPAGERFVLWAARELERFDAQSNNP